MKKTLYTALAFLIPAAAFAQANDMDTVDEIFIWFVRLIDVILIPLAFSLALIFFLFGVFKYFFSSGASAEENRQQGKKYIVWAIVGFVVMISIWGIVNVIVRTFKFEDASRPNLPCFSRNSPNCNPSGGGSSQGLNGAASRI